MADVILRPFDPSDAEWVIDRHRDLYARDEGFDATFGRVVADAVTAFASDHDPARECGFIALIEGIRVGSIFCTRSDAPDAARLRLFLVLPEARRRGIGVQLLQACIEFARQVPVQKMQVSTYEEHRAACALYAANGFQCTMRWPARAFGKDLVEQSWERVL
ncbi:MAG: GNAT family N-acetyltransferase [Pseudomonadota bacterium]